MSGRLVAGGWLAAFGVCLLTMPGTFYFEDGPELLACAAVLGNTHPPGYPLLMLAGRLALDVPLGGPGFRFNLLVAACGAGAAVLLGVLGARVARLIGAPPPVAAWSGVFAAAAWGLSDTVWWEAVIGDKYAPYYLGWVAAVLAAVAAATVDLPVLGRAWARLGLALGVAFALHQYAVFALPAVAAAAARALVMRAFGARVRVRRTLALAAVGFLLALSTRLVVPPIRSAAGADLDWGRPRTAARWAPYLTGALYHGVFASTSLAINPRLWSGRAGLAGRLVREEFPLPMLAGLLAGVPALSLASPLVALGLGGCALADAAYASNFSEKIVRWWEPAYAVGIVGAAAGLAWLLSSLMRGRRARAATLGMAVLAIAAALVQAGRGWPRNDLSRFTAAHDLGRNLLRSLPRDAVYLGAGDFDLFPLWALGLVDHERPDVTAAGLAAFVDPRLAVSGQEERLAARYGVHDTGGAALAGMLTASVVPPKPGPGGRRHGPPLYFAASGNDPQVQKLFPFLASLRARGLVGRPVRHWDPAGSASDSRRAARAYTYRNLAYGPHGALGELGRFRDEVARGALLQYTGCFITLGRQLGSFGLTADTAWANRQARRMMAPLTGPLSPPPPAEWLSPEAARSRADQQAVALGYLRLADVCAGRGITFLETQFRENARAALQ